MHRYMKSLGGFRTLGLCVALIALPPLLSLPGMTNSAFANRVQIFAQIENTVVQLFIPLICSFLGASMLATEVHHRRLSQVLVRVDPRTAIRKRLAFAFFVPFFAGALNVALCWSIAFVVWPRIGDPWIQPSIYNLTTSSAERFGTELYSYSQLLAVGPAAFGLFYGLVFAGACGLFGLGAALACLLVPNLAVALLLPTGVFLLETVGAALAGDPRAGLLYAVVPFGLTQGPVAGAVLPLVIFAIATFGVAGWVHRHPSRLQAAQ
jgi:hypothetical protein